MRASGKPLELWGHCAYSQIVAISQATAIATIRRTLDQALHGRPARLLIQGEPGIGKTTVLNAVAELADEMRVIRITGVETEPMLPYADLLSLGRPLRPLIERLGPRQRRALLVALSEQDGPETSPLGVGAALLQLLAEAAAIGPLVILVDDLQWLDEQSLGAMLFALRRLGGEPVLAVVAARAKSAAACCVADFPTLTLGGIDADAATTMLMAHGIHLARPVIDELIDATAGNPLAVLMVGSGLDPAQRLGLRAWDGDADLAVGERISHGFRERIAGLSSETGRALLVVALAHSSERPYLENAMRYCGIDVSCLDSAVRCGVVRLTPTTVEFCHPLIRAAVRHLAADAVRRDAHRALARSSGDALSVTNDRRHRAAWHRAAAAVLPDERLALEMVDAGQDAANRGDLTRASRAWEVAATLTPGSEARSRRLFFAGHAAAMTGLSEADNILERARALSANPELLEEIDVVASSLAAWSGRNQRALAIADRYPASTQHVSAERRTTVAMVHGTAVIAAWMMGDHDAVERHAHQLPVFTEDLSPAAKIMCGVGRSRLALLDGTMQTTDLLRAAGVHHRTPVPDYATPLAHSLLLADEITLAAEVVADALIVARHAAQIPAIAWLQAVAASVQLRQGKGLAAHASACEAVELSRAVSAPLAQLQSEAVRLLVRATTGIAAVRWAEIDRLRASASALGYTAALRYLDLVEARSAASLNDTDAAIAAYIRAVTHPGHPSLGEPGAIPELIGLLIRRGRRQEAAAQMERLDLAMASDCRPSARAWRAHCRAMTCGDGDAEAHFHDALDLWSSAVNAGGRAETTLQYGVWLRRVGRPDEAAAVLRSALALFEASAIRPGADLACQELATLGVHSHSPRGATPAPLSLLSPREDAIAIRAATGATTQEIASELFLSRKTVEAHLTHIYRKLGVRSRTQLAYLFRRRPG